MQLILKIIQSNMKNNQVYNKTKLEQTLLSNY